MGKSSVASVLGENFIVRPELRDKKLSESLVLPEAYVGRSLFATVEVAPDNKHEVKVGDRVMLKPDYGIDLKDGTFCVHYNEITAIDDGEFPLKMVRDHVLVKALEYEKASKSIYLPNRGSDDTERTGIDDTQTGIVVSVGGGYVTDKGVIPVDVNAGDFIAFHGGITSGISVIINGDEYRILRESDIMLSWKEEENDR